MKITIFLMIKKSVDQDFIVTLMTRLIASSGDENYILTNHWQYLLFGPCDRSGIHVKGALTPDLIIDKNIHHNNIAE